MAIILWFYVPITTHSMYLSVTNGPLTAAGLRSQSRHSFR